MDVRRLGFIRILDRRRSKRQIDKQMSKETRRGRRGWKQGAPKRQQVREAELVKYFSG